VTRGPALLLAALALAAAGCGGEDDEGDVSRSRAEGSGGGCKDVEESAPGEDGGERKPTRKLDAARTYAVTLVTSCGDITIRLDVEASPDTTASFVSLARRGFFDGTVFHRIVPGFVIQGGDPTASGSGGPGYSTVDEPPRDTGYGKGTVAMAKTADEAPGTAGSQFYIVTGDASQLPPEYAVLGKVTRGMDVAERIGRLGDPQSGDLGTPLRTVLIERTRVDVS
jgi:peptidyl-prolyl cis-trans isomerase B (cyclophilin B)